MLTEAPHGRAIVAAASTLTVSTTSCGAGRGPVTARFAGSTSMAYQGALLACTAIMTHAAKGAGATQKEVGVGHRDWWKDGNRLLRATVLATEPEQCLWK